MGIQEERAELERALAGQTICTALAETAQRHGDLPAYSEFCDRVRVVRDLSGLERAAHELAGEVVGR